MKIFTKKMAQSVEYLLKELNKFKITDLGDIRLFIHNISTNVNVNEHLVNGLILDNMLRFPPLFIKQWMLYIVDEYDLKSFSKKEASEKIGEALGGWYRDAYKEEPIKESIPKDRELSPKIIPVPYADILNEYTEDEIWDIASGKKTDVTEEKIEQAKEVIQRGIIANKLSMKKFAIDPLTQREILLTGLMFPSPEFIENLRLKKEKDKEDQKNKYDAFKRPFELKHEKGLKETIRKNIEEQFIIPQQLKLRFDKIAQLESFDYSYIKSNQATKNELKRLYIQEAKGIYNEKLINEVISKFLVIFEYMINWDEQKIKSRKFDYTGQKKDLEENLKTERKLIQTLQFAKTPEQKMIAIDQVINTAHKEGVYGDYLIENYDYSFFEELSNLKISSLNLKRKAQIEYNIGDTVEFDTTRYYGAIRKGVGGILKGKGIIKKKNEDGTYDVEIKEVINVAKDLKNLFVPGFISPFFPDEFKFIKEEITKPIKKEIPVEEKPKPVEPKVEEKEKIPTLIEEPELVLKKEPEEKVEPSQLRFELEEPMEEKPEEPEVAFVLTPTILGEPPEKEEEKPFWKQLVDEIWKGFKKPVSWKKPLGNILTLRKKFAQLDKQLFFDFYGVFLLSDQYLEANPYAKQYKNMIVQQVKDEYIPLITKMVYEELSENIDKVDWKKWRNKFNVKSPKDLTLEQLAEVYYEGKWSLSDWGGSVWGNIVDSLIQLQNTTDTNQLITIIDHINDIEHNTEKLFQNIPRVSKWFSDALDIKFNATPEQLILYLSSDLQRIVIEDLQLRGEEIIVPEEYLTISERLELAETSNDPKILSELAKDKNSDIRKEVANNISVTLEILYELAKDENIGVQYAVFLNPLTPKEIKKQLKKEFYASNLSMRKTASIQTHEYRYKEFHKNKIPIYTFYDYWKSPQKTILMFNCDICGSTISLSPEEIEAYKNRIKGLPKNWKEEIKIAKLNFKKKAQNDLTSEEEKFVDNFIKQYEYLHDAEYISKELKDKLFMHNLISYLEENLNISSDRSPHIASEIYDILEKDLKILGNYNTFGTNLSMKKKAKTFVEGTPIDDAGSWAIYNGNVYVNYDENKYHIEWFEELELPTSGEKYDNIVRGYFKDGYIVWYGTGDFNELYDYLEELRNALKYPEDAEIRKLDKTVKQFEVLAMKKKLSIPNPVLEKLDYLHSWSQKKKKIKALNLRKISGNYLSPQELLRFYKLEEKGLLTDEIVDNIITKMIYGLEEIKKNYEITPEEAEWKIWMNKVKDSLINLEAVLLKDLNSKIMAIDEVIWSLHQEFLPNIMEGNWEDISDIFDYIFYQEGTLTERNIIEDLRLKEKTEKISSTVSEPIPDNSLSEQQGEHQGWHSYFEGKDRWEDREPDLGFDIKFPEKVRIKRDPWMFEDNPVMEMRASLSMRKISDFSASLAISDIEIPENWGVQDKTNKKLRRTNPPRHDKNDSIVEHNLDPHIDLASLNLKENKQIYKESLLSDIPVDFKDVDDIDLHEEVLRAGMIAELDAINLYEQMVSETTNENIKKILLDIAKEEKTHLGEFETLLLGIDKEQKEELEKGKEEVEELTKLSMKKYSLELKKRKLQIDKQLFFDFYGVSLLSDQYLEANPYAKEYKDMIVQQARDEYVPLITEMVYEEFEQSKYYLHNIKKWKKEFGLVWKKNVISIGQEFTNKEIRSLTLEQLARIYNEGKWDPTWGGKPWGHITESLIQLKNTTDTNQLVNIIDHINDIEHNTGLMFHDFPKVKKWFSDALEIKANATPEQLIPYLSSDLKKMVTEDLQLRGQEVVTSIEYLTISEKIQLARTSKDSKILKELAQDENEEIILAITDNVNAPLNILDDLSKSSNLNVRLALVEYFGLYPITLLRLSKDENFEVRRKAKNQINILKNWGKWPSNLSLETEDQIEVTPEEEEIKQTEEIISNNLNMRKNSFEGQLTDKNYNSPSLLLREDYGTPGFPEEPAQAEVEDTANDARWNKENLLKKKKPTKEKIFPDFNIPFGMEGNEPRQL